VEAGSVWEGERRGTCSPPCGPTRLPAYYVVAVGVVEFDLNNYASLSRVAVSDFPAETLRDACLLADALVSEKAPLYGVERTTLPAVVLTEQNHDRFVKFKFLFANKPAKTPNLQSL
jgi:hypothetical protein